MAIILVFGASGEYGAWDEEGGWVSRLRKYLDSNGDEDLIYNLGVSNDTSADILKRFKHETDARISEVKLYKERLVILISIGKNDSALLNGKARVGAKQYNANIKKLVKLAKSYTKEVFFVEIWPVDDLRTNPVWWYKQMSYKNKSIAEYNRELHEVCKKAGINFVALPTTVKVNYKALLSDGVHPNEKGHEITYRAVKDLLVKKKIIS